MENNKENQNIVPDKEFLKWYRLQKKRLSYERHKQMEKNEFKRMFARDLIRDYCTVKMIRSYISQLRKEGKITGKYRPNIKGIQHMFGRNAAEIEYVMHEYKKESMNGFENTKNISDIRVYGDNYYEELIKPMPKQIILCDYEKRNYFPPQPHKPDWILPIN